MQLVRGLHTPYDMTVTKQKQCQTRAEITQEALHLAVNFTSACHKAGTSDDNHGMKQVA